MFKYGKNNRYMMEDELDSYSNITVNLLKDIQGIQDEN